MENFTSTFAELVTETAFFLFVCLFDAKQTCYCEPGKSDTKFQLTNTRICAISEHNILENVTILCLLSDDTGMQMAPSSAQPP
jgi:hypothetical protein